MTHLQHLQALHECYVPLHKPFDGLPLHSHVWLTCLVHYLQALHEY